MKYCEMYAQGITITATLQIRGAAIRDLTSGDKKNHCHAEEYHAFAHTCHLHAIADKIVHMFELLKLNAKQQKKNYEKSLPCGTRHIASMIAQCRSGAL